MGWDGSGNVVRTDGSRTGATVFQQQQSANVAVNAPDMDTHAQDLADAIENCVARDGQNTPSADLPMGGRKHTGVADAAAENQYATLKQVNASATPFLAAAAVGGTANAITLTPDPAVTTLTVGRGYRFFVKLQNTDAVTVAVNAITAVALVKADGSAFGSGELTVGRHVTAIYNGTSLVSDVGAEGGASLDIFTQVPTAVTAVANDDRLAGADVSLAGEPNRYYTPLQLMQRYRWTGTQDQYNAIVTKDPNVMYLVR